MALAQTWQAQHALHPAQGCLFSVQRKVMQYLQPLTF